MGNSRSWKPDQREQIGKTGVLSQRGDINSAIHSSAIYSSAIYTSAIHGSAMAMGFSFSVDFGHNGRPSISTPRMGSQRR